jgi:hypothetical protein
MKTYTFLKIIILCVFTVCFLSAQNTSPVTVNGEILFSSENLTVIKVWGTQQEMGFAYGYLLPHKIRSVGVNGLIPLFGNYYEDARSILSDTNNFRIDSIYIIEAQAIIRGMETASPGITADLDFIDVLLGTAADDVQDLLATSGYQGASTLERSCSGLISWGEATEGTVLDGKTVVAHHNDGLPIDTCLTNNQVVIVRIPSEDNKQPWLSVVYAGDIGAYQGTNKSGISIFLQAMNIDGTPSKGKKYEPTWFTTRKGLETRDFNDDGRENTEDFKDLPLTNPDGFASSLIFAVSAPSTEVHDSLIALMIETTHADPIYTFRANSYEDMIPGDNLYSANSSIKRKDSRLYCSRYYNVASHIGDGMNIDSLKQWELMRDWSNQWNNYQFMQIIPELKVFKLAVRTLDTPAYQTTPMYFDLDVLFADPVTDVKDEITLPAGYVLEQNCPNPFNPSTVIGYRLTVNSYVTLKVYDILGREVETLVDTEQPAGVYEVEFNVGTNRRFASTSGVYLYQLKAGNYTATRKMLILN